MRHRGGKTCLACPLLNCGRLSGLLAYRVFKIHGGVRKVGKPEYPGPEHGLVRHFAQRVMVRERLLDPLHAFIEFGTELAQTHHGALVSEQIAGLFESLLVLHACRYLIHRTTSYHRHSSDCTRCPFHNMKGSVMKYPKFCVPVKATLENGSQYFGGVHVSQNQRILDVLCDDRPFIPFKLRDRTILLNKSKLVQVDLLDMTEISEMADVLPELNLDYLKANDW